MTPPTPATQINLNTNLILQKIKELDLPARKKEFEEQVKLMGEYFEIEMRKANAVLDNIKNQIVARNLEYEEIKVSNEAATRINDEWSQRLKDKENLLTEIEEKLGKMNESIINGANRNEKDRKEIEELCVYYSKKRQEHLEEEKSFKLQQTAFMEISQITSERIYKKESELVQKEADLKNRESEVALKLETYNKDLDKMAKARKKLESQQAILAQQLKQYKDARR